MSTLDLERPKGGANANGRQIPWGYSLAWKAKQLMYKYASAEFLSSIGMIEQGAT